MVIVDGKSYTPSELRKGVKSGGKTIYYTGGGYGQPSGMDTKINKDGSFSVTKNGQKTYYDKSGNPISVQQPSQTTYSPFKTTSRYEQIVSDAQSKPVTTQQQQAYKIKDQLKQFQNMSLSGYGEAEKLNLERQAWNLAENVYRTSTPEQKLGYNLITAYGFSANSVDYWISSNKDLRNLLGFKSPEQYVIKDIAKSMGMTNIEFQREQALNNPITQFLVYRGAGQVTIPALKTIGYVGSKIPYVNKVVSGIDSFISSHPKEIKYGLGALYVGSEAYNVGNQYSSGVSTENIVSGLTKRTINAIGFTTGISSYMKSIPKPKVSRSITNTRQTGLIEEVNFENKMFKGSAQAKSVSLVRSGGDTKWVYTDTSQKFVGKTLDDGTAILQDAYAESWSAEPTHFTNLFGNYQKITTYSSVSGAYQSGVKTIKSQGELLTNVVFTKGKNSYAFSIFDDIAKSQNAVLSRFTTTGLSGKHLSVVMGKAGMEMPNFNYVPKNMGGFEPTFYKPNQPSTAMKPMTFQLTDIQKMDLNKQVTSATSDLIKTVTSNVAKTMVKPAQSYLAMGLASSQLFDRYTKSVSKSKTRIFESLMITTGKEKISESVFQGQERIFDLGSIRITTPITTTRIVPAYDQTIVQVPPTTPNPIFEYVPVIPPPVPFPMMDAGLGFGWGRGTKTLGKRKRKYQPSLLAIGWNITGKAPKVLTGSEIRPMSSKYKYKNPFF